jgi:hypothetical protein
MSQIKHIKISELIPDERNANKGTPRGAQALEDSLKRYGAGRSILIDKNGRIIAGNKTFEQAGASGFNDVIIVKTDGKKIVAVQREDLDLNTDPEARGLAIADNRAGQLGLDWDAEQLLEDVKQIGDMEPFFYQNELDDLIEQAAKDVGEAGEEGIGEEGGNKAIRCSIVFNNEREKAIWDRYLKFLEKKYPYYETQAERIVADIAKNMQ